jgi:hypothetical protein
MRPLLNLLLSKIPLKEGLVKILLGRKREYFRFRGRKEGVPESEVSLP